MLVFDPPDLGPHTGSPATICRNSEKIPYSHFKKMIEPLTLLKE